MLLIEKKTTEREFFQVKIDKILTPINKKNLFLIDSIT